METPTLDECLAYLDELLTERSRGTFDDAVIHEIKTRLIEREMAKKIMAGGLDTSSLWTDADKALPGRPNV